MRPCKWILWMWSRLPRGSSDWWRNPELREQYIRKGFDRVKEFTWERTARETLAVYQKTLGGD